MRKRKKTFKKALKEIEKIRNSVPKIIFKTKNLIVTLKHKRQLDRWIKLYPDGEYIINSQLIILTKTNNYEKQKHKNENI